MASSYCSSPFSDGVHCSCWYDGLDCCSCGEGHEFYDEDDYDYDDGYDDTDYDDFD